MATCGGISSGTACLLHRPLSFIDNWRLTQESRWVPTTIRRRLYMGGARVSASAAVSLEPELLVDEAKLKLRRSILACPICFEPVIWKGVSSLSLDSVAQSTLQCEICKKSFSGRNSHIDMTVTSGKVYGETLPASTQVFRLPLVSFLYERGWRQSLSLLGGFPGPEKEFELIKDYLKPVSGGNIVDASCGSGLFSRLFAKSGLFSLVVGLDFSEAMLQQCYDFVKQEENFPEENMILVRADISRLPFASCTIDAVHAGAALHCWPSPSAAVAEISRVLKPGGTFVATTFILDGPFSYLPLRSTVQQNMARFSGYQLFFSDTELEDLCASCGLVNFRCSRNGRFVIIAAMKPL